MIEIPLEYWNKLAGQLITISSLLAGFSIAVTANLLVSESKKRLSITLLKVSTVASGCFLVTVFAMTKILLLTTHGYHADVTGADLVWPRVLGFLTFISGIISLSLLLALSGWTKSRRTGIFTTIVGSLTFFMILMTIIEIRG